MAPRYLHGMRTPWRHPAASIAATSSWHGCRGIDVHTVLDLSTTTNNNSSACLHGPSDLPTHLLHSPPPLTCAACMQVGPGVQPAAQGALPRECRRLVPPAPVLHPSRPGRRRSRQRQRLQQPWQPWAGCSCGSWVGQPRCGGCLTHPLRGGGPAGGALRRAGPVRPG